MLPCPPQVALLIMAFAVPPVLVKLTVLPLAMVLAGGVHGQTTTTVGCQNRQVVIRGDDALVDDAVGGSVREGLGA